MAKISQAELEERAKRKAARLEQEQNEVKKIRNKIIAITAAVIAVIVLAVGIVVAVDSSGNSLRSEVAVSTENFEINNAMMSYFMHDNYNSIKEYYGDYASYYGLVTTKKLKTQYTSDGQTWFDYVAEITTNELTTMLSNAEAALAAGIELSETDMAHIEQKVERINPRAYGTGVKKSDILDCFKIYYLAYKYEVSVNEEATADFTPELLESTYQADPKAHQYANYMYYKFSYGEGGDTTQEEATADSAELAATTSRADFELWIRNYLTAKGNDETAVANAIEAAYNADLSYYEGNPICEWLFSGTVKSGETYTETDEENSTIEVYMCVDEPSRKEEITKNVRHILFAFENYDSENDAYIEAERVYNEWKAGAATEATFAQYAAQYTQDDGSYFVGGLYENVYVGQMVSEFNDWCFDEARVAGDSDLIVSEYGAHIMYFVGDGVQVWEGGVMSELAKAEINTVYEANQASYPLTINNDVIQKISM